METCKDHAAPCFRARAGGSRRERVRRSRRIFETYYLIYRGCTHILRKMACRRRDRFNICANRAVVYPSSPSQSDVCEAAFAGNNSRYQQCKEHLKCHRDDLSESTSTIACRGEHRIQANRSTIRKGRTSLSTLDSLPALSALVVSTRGAQERHHEWAILTFPTSK